MNSARNGRKRHDFDGLTAKQTRVIEELLSNPTIKSKVAAEAIEVGVRTIFTWLNEPKFRAAYLAARQQSVESAISWLQSASAGAVGVLIKNLRCCRPRDEIRAAQLILEFSLRSIELDDLVERVEALEQKHKDGKRWEA
jgi:hypothetical protein